MEFRNHTPFPALAFEGIDQHEQAFHVVVLRQTLSYAAGKLEYADEQAPLCEVDEFWEEMNRSSVRQESDLCQYKPKCDVIVNGTAYAPRNQPVARFDVRLQVSRPGLPHLLPEAPHGLNHRMAPAQADLDKWQREVSRIKALPAPRIALIDKALTVCGERHFFRAGMVLSSWEPTVPKTLTSLPLRYEYAFGGQCRIDATDLEAAKRLPKAYWMTPEQREQHPEKDNPPIAHQVYEPNIIGRGYAQTWYLDATKCASVAAPQITYPDAPVDAALFKQVAQGKESNAPALSPAGFGIRAKIHPKRRALLGTVDQAFIKSDAWLPPDFDFAVWNAAPEDQQTEHLQGDETIELTNLCQAGTPCCTTDAQGNTHLALDLPADECYLQIRLKSGVIAAMPLVIDTVLLEPDSQTLTLVWRTTLPKSKEAPIAMLEACMTPPNQPGGRNPGGLPLPLEERARRLTEQTIARILNADQPSEVVNG